MSFFEKLILIKSIQEHLSQLLQTVPTSKMLQVPLCLDALFELLKQSVNKPSLDVSQKFALHRPNSTPKAMYGLFKFYGNRARHLSSQTHFAKIEDKKVIAKN